MQARRLGETLELVDLRSAGRPGQHPIGVVAGLHRQICPQGITGPVDQAGRAGRLEGITYRLPAWLLATVVNEFEGNLNRIGLAGLAMVDHELSRRAKVLIVWYFENKAVQGQVELFLLQEPGQGRDRIFDFGRLQAG